MARILLVEDDETSRDMLKLRLELNGHEVLVAIDGEQALVYARERSPQLVLLDMNLPKLDGWTVARWLKDEAATANIPLIGVSAHAMEGDRERALRSGCDEYETKPVDWSRLGQKIDQLLKRHP